MRKEVIAHKEAHKDPVIYRSLEGGREGGRKGGREGGRAGGREDGERECHMFFCSFSI